MDREFWLKRWQNQETGFHRTDVHPKLPIYFKNPRNGKVLVPLCGKSLDLIWLSKTWEVVGAELSPIACQTFFEENHLKFKVTEYDGFQVFKGEKITLWCGDFFNLPKEAWKGVTAIYDRAALVALPEDIRKKYVSVICENTYGVEKFCILIISLEYPKGSAEGPPFRVTSEEIQLLFGKQFNIQLLFSETEDAYFKTHERLGGIPVTERTYQLTAV